MSKFTPEEQRLLDRCCEIRRERPVIRPNADQEDLIYELGLHGMPVDLNGRFIRDEKKAIPLQVGEAKLHEMGVHLVVASDDPDDPNLYVYDPRTDFVAGALHRDMFAYWCDEDREGYLDVLRAKVFLRRLGIVRNEEDGVFYAIDVD